MGSSIYIYSVLLLYVIFSSNCFTMHVAADESFLDFAKYYSYEELTDFLKDLVKQYPNLAKLYSIGKSVENRELWVIEINSNVSNRTTLIPMVKYVANIHGDETVGRQLMIYLAKYLLSNYGKDNRITKLVDTTDIHLMPSLNPDGNTASEEGNCYSLEGFVGRKNVNDVDLNRDFPDRLGPKLETETILSGRQPETIAMMTWVLSKPFVLSGSFHGGAVVAVYPFDNSPTEKYCCEESLSPDDAIFKKLALTYASNNPSMKEGDACEEEKFPQGITNGAFWYVLDGGMQDFNYFHSNCFEVTFELSCCKFPNASTLQDEWNKNKESLLSYIESVHWGVKGTVADDEGNPVIGADIIVEGINHNITTTDRGEYWRLLVPGVYNIWASANGFVSSDLIHITVEEGETLIKNFTLNRQPLPKGNVCWNNALE